MRKFCIWLLFLILQQNLSAQLYKDVFPLSREFKPYGFYGNPELNYSLPLYPYSKQVNQANQTYSIDNKGGGKLGFGLELGGFYAFKYPRLIHLIEMGVSYRMYQGKVEHTGKLDSAGITRTYFSNNSFSMGTIGLAIRAKHIKQLNKHSFLTNAIGLNINYLIQENYTRSAEYPHKNETFPDKYNVQLHYEIGIGIRLSETVYLTPSIETPIIYAFPLEKFQTGLTYFDQQFQPIIFKLRILLLLKDPVNCNAPVYKGPVANP